MPRDRPSRLVYAVCMRRVPFLVTFLLWACVTTPPSPPAPTAPPEPKTSPVAQGTDDEPPAVAIDLSEVTLRIEADGTSTRTWREIYRLRSAEPGDGWTHVFAFWRPWGDEPPTIDATVVAPDGTAQKLDPKTVSDQANKNDDGMLTDEKLRIAPLPGLALGSVVERTSVVHRKPLFVKGTSLTFFLDPPAPEKKRVFVIDAPANVPLHLETFDTGLVPTRTEANGRVLVRYERGPATPRHRGEVGAPAEATPEPMVRVSTVASWQAAAAAWAERVEPQFDVPAVKTLAASLVAGQTTREGKVQALLAWMRGTIRYTGLELDEAAWVPRRSGEVLERKYGDCKDMSVLLTAMLRSVGIDADPALLSAGFSRDTSPGSPGLTNFNHVVVRVGSGPTWWVDATAPWTALGELPPGVAGRQALVARADTTALTPIVATAGSRLDTKVDWFFAASGPVRTVRKRTSEGWIFRDAREIAARSKDQYRKNLETWAKERHDAKGPIAVDISDATAAGAFREDLEIPDSHWGGTDPDQAVGFVGHDMAFAPVRYLTTLEDKLDARQQPFTFINGARAHVVNAYHPPVGYRIKELPTNVKETLGPLSVSLEWKRAAGDDIEATLDVDFKGGTVSVEEARRFVKEVFPRLDVRVAFPNAVLSAIKDSRFHAAAMEAEALLAKHPTATWRSMLAYALSAAGLQADAELEARKAVAEAPRDPLVRNRLAFVLLHNEQGIEFGHGFKRAELIKLLEESLALAPDNEWTRRMHALVLLYDENGAFVSDPRVLQRLEGELAEYREKTKFTELDDEALDVLLKQRAWDRILAEAPKFPQTNQRDGAWLASELVLKGVEGTFQRAAQEKRLNDESSGLATQYVMLAREYGTLAQLFAFVEKMRKDERQGEAKNDEMTRVLSSIKKQPPPPAGTVQATWIRLSTLLINNASLVDLREVVGGELTEQGAREARRAVSATLGELPRGGADTAGFSQDFTLAVGTFEQKPLPGFGELVTLRLKLRSVSAPTTMLMTKGPKGYQVRFDLGPEIAAKIIELLQQNRPTEAKELLRALVMMTPNAPPALKEERADLEQAGYAWAALTGLKHPGATHVAKWLEAEVTRTDLDEMTFQLAASGVEKAWKENPEKRLALARQLEQSPLAGRREGAVLLRLTALRDQGKYQEAMAVVEKELTRAPRDLRMREFKSHLLAQLGLFEQSRAVNRQLAAEVEPQRAAGFLNDAAWWSLYGGVDEDAVQEIQRSRQLSSAPSFVNTAACVYAAAGKYDSAAQEILRMVRGSSDRSEQDLHPSYWYARGLMAEGFGRLETARGFYKKVTKEKTSSPADVWHLAQKRLDLMGSRK